MKTLLCVVLAALPLLTSNANAMFGHAAAEKERRVETEQQLAQEQQVNAHLHVAISVLSAGAVTALIVGAAIGSKTRRDHAIQQ